MIYVLIWRKHLACLNRMMFDPFARATLFLNVINDALSVQAEFFVQPTSCKLQLAEDALQ